MFGGNDKMPQDKMPRDEMAQKSPHPEMYCNDWLTINWYGGYRLKAGTGLCIIVFVHIMCSNLTFNLNIYILRQKADEPVTVSRSDQEGYISGLL